MTILSDSYEHETNLKYTNMYADSRLIKSEPRLEGMGLESMTLTVLVMFSGWVDGWLQVARKLSRVLMHVVAVVA